MKFNFKKVVSVLATTAMLGSTVAFAAAAYPAPFVSNGAADAAIVYGSTADSGDMAAAIDLQAALNAGVTVTSTSGTVTGEAKAVETSGQKLYVGDYMNTTKESFTKNELPVVLADGKVTDVDGTDFTYTQKVYVPNTFVGFGKTSDNLAAPILYANFEDSNEYYTEEITFPTAVNVTKLADKDITIFGKKYSFSGNSADLTTSKIVMYENTQTATINSGEEKSVVVGDKTYVIAVTGVEDASNAVITVNGVSQKVTETNSYKVAGLDLYIKNVMGASVAGEVRAVEVSMGSAKLTLQDGNDVTMGSTTVYGARTTITTSGSKVSKISVKVTPYSLDNRQKYLKIGDSMSDPVFGAFKMSFVSYSPAMDAATKDDIKIKSSGEMKGSMKWTNKAGGVYDMDMFKPSSVPVDASGVANGTFVASASWPNNATMLGYDTYDIMTSASAQVNENDYVITNNNEYSQIFRVDRIDVTNNKVKIRDQASGSAVQELSLSGASIGSTGTLSLADGSSATITLTGNLSGSENITVSKASPILYTQGGAKVDLTYVANPVLYNQTSSKIVVTEETSYNDGDFKKNTGATLGSTVNTTVLYNRATKTGNDIFLNAPAVGDSYSGTVGDYDVQYLTKYGTFVKQTGNDDKTVEIFYSGTAANLGFYIAEQSAVTGADASKVQVLKDTQAATAKDKNLIVVGGSCVNTVAATILGSTTPLCGADFSAKTNVGAGQYLIQLVASPLNAQKVAMLVAGYDVAQTVAAKDKVKEGNVDTTKMGSTVYPVATA
jgi:hypothetical protein